ncbi:MAG: VTT domain-containing protein, partial [Deltaproteobacteria bacterium]|nr:VTT domain-containing protein [Deltaproteobacteria bacterium]
YQVILDSSDLGRIKNISLIERHLSWKANYDRASALLHKHQIPVIMGFRFIYGMRTITPFLIGLSRVKPFTFFLLNSIGALIWAVTIALLRYFIGNAIKLMFQEVRRYEIIVAITIMGIGTII